VFLAAFGRAGALPGEVARPMHMDVRDGKLYVAEYLNDRIQIFSLNGESLGSVGSPGSGPGQFDSPGGVAVDGEGRLYVADFFNHRVQVLDGGGKFLRQYGTTGKKGMGRSSFNYPTDVAILQDGSLVTADAYNDRVQVFRADGTWERKWGGPLATDIPGGFNGWFRVATAVAAGPAGNIFVADFYNHRIQKFTRQGKFLVALGSEGSGPGEFIYPTDVAVDDEGGVYVVDFGNNRIQKFAPR
jgi:DNA-binding beta-propeller fold protein YncE